MEQFDSFLAYEKDVAEFKLRTINRLQKGLKPKTRKRTSNVETVQHVLRIAGRPFARFGDNPNCKQRLPSTIGTGFNRIYFDQEDQSWPKIYQDSSQYLCLERIVCGSPKAMEIQHLPSTIGGCHDRGNQPYSVAV